MSNWEIVLDSINQTVSLQMLNGANVPINSVDIADVVVIDETDVSLEETFGSVSVLRTRLIELNYTPYIILNGFVPEAPIDGLTYGRKDAGWVEVSGGGSVGTLQQVTDNGNTITSGDYIALFEAGVVEITNQNTGTSTIISADEGVSIKTDAFQGKVKSDDLTSARVYQLPDANGTIALTSNIPTVDDTPTDGSSNAVSSNGVFDALTLKQDFATDSFASTITFDVPKVYNSFSSPSSSNISQSLTGARIGVVQKFYSNKATEPTYPAGWVKLSGTYTNSVTNIIYAEWCEGSRVEYWIVKA